MIDGFEYLDDALLEDFQAEIAIMLAEHSINNVMLTGEISPDKSDSFDVFSEFTADINKGAVVLYNGEDEVISEGTRSGNSSGTGATPGDFMLLTSGNQVAEGFPDRWSSGLKDYDPPSDPVEDTPEDEVIVTVT